MRKAKYTVKPTTQFKKDYKLACCKMSTQNYGVTLIFRSCEKMPAGVWPLHYPLVDATVPYSLE